MEQEKKLLDKFYRELYTSLQSQGKLKQNSVLISFIKMNSNNRFRAFDKSSLNSAYEDKTIIDGLSKKGFIRKNEKLNEYVITATGVFEIEKNELEEDYVIKNLDKIYFDLFKSSEKPLESKEKIVILSLIAVRAFSEGVTIKLNKEDRVLEVLGEIFELCQRKLQELGIISKEANEEVYGAFKNEKVVSGIFRRLNNLPKKTNNLYNFKKGGHAYYLDISKDNLIDPKKLSYLLKLIWGDKILSAGEVENIHRFLSEISDKYGIYLFESHEKIFSRPKYDEEIKKALYKSI